MMSVTWQLLLRMQKKLHVGCLMNESPREKLKLSHAVKDVNSSIILVSVSCFLFNGVSFLVNGELFENGRACHPHAVQLFCSRDVCNLPRNGTAILQMIRAQN